jgi:hypothetical protein
MLFRGHAVAIACLFVLVLRGSTVAADVVPWKITPPSGWRDATEDALRTPAMQASRDKAAAQGGTTDIKLYRSDSGDYLLINYLQINHARAAAAELAAIRSFERGARDSMRKMGAETAYTSQHDGKTFVAEQTVTTPERTIRGKRLAGLIGREMRVVAVLCAGSAPDCVPALASLSIDDSAFRPLTRTVSPDDAAWALGEAVGRLVFPVLVIAAVVVGLVRLRRKRPRRWLFAVAIAIVCVVGVLGLLMAR